jgi:hypothetical protein
MWYESSESVELLKGEGVEFLESKSFVDERGPGRYTHKRIYLGKYPHTHWTSVLKCWIIFLHIISNRRLPSWLRTFIPTTILRIDEQGTTGTMTRHLLNFLFFEWQLKLNFHEIRSLESVPLYSNSVFCNYEKFSILNERRTKKEKIWEK